MKVAIVQFKADTNEQKNLDKILDYVHKAAKKGAELCAFPEFKIGRAHV